MHARRIGLFTECYRPVVNGIVAAIDSLASSLRENGHDVKVVTPSMPRYVDAGSDVVRLRSLPLPTPTAYRLTVPYLPGTIGELSIVHAHSPFITGVLGVIYARRAGIPLVFTYHTQLEAYAHYVPGNAGLTRRAASLVTRRFANVADAVVVPTEAMRRRLLDLGVRTRIVVVPSGIDVAAFALGRRRFDLRARFGASPADDLVLVVGRLGREKNLELALAAFARLDRATARLAFVGDGPHRAELEALAVRLGIEDRVTFAGAFAREELPDAYASADTFLFTSRSDTQGVVLAEALAAGLAVVALDVPQTRDVLGEAGHLAPDDPAELARIVARTLAGDRDPEPGRRRAANFDATAIGARVLRVYESLL